MKNLIKAALFFTSATIAFSQPAFAQQTNDSENLQRRMNSLESKVDALIGLMQKQQAGQQNGTPKDTEASAHPRDDKPPIPDGYVQGMYLDVFASGVYFDKSEDHARIEIPDASPSASVKVPSQSTFRYDQFLDFKETSPFQNVSDSLVGVEYSAYLTILKNGDHVFQVSTHGAERMRCVTKLYLGSQVLGSKDNHESVVSGFQTKTSLRRGLYEVKLYLVCQYNWFNRIRIGGQPVNVFKGVDVALTLGEPGDHAPHPIQADRLLIKQ